MTSGRLWALSVGMLLAGSELGAQRAAESLACVTLLDATDRHAVSGARVSLVGTTPGSGPVTTSNATGRACLPARDSIALQIDAVGYRPIDVAIGTSAAPQVTMQQLPNGVMLPEWGSRQMVAALVPIATSIGR
jgi:hypothetical protein